MFTTCDSHRQTWDSLHSPPPPPPIPSPLPLCQYQVCIMSVIQNRLTGYYRMMDWHLCSSACLIFVFQGVLTSICWTCWVPWRGRGRATSMSSSSQRRTMSTTCSSSPRWTHTMVTFVPLNVCSNVKVYAVYTGFSQTWWVTAHVGTFSDFP